MRKFFILIAFAFCNLILFASNSIRITTISANALHYKSFLKQSDISLAANKTYLVSFWAKANNFLYLKSMVSNNDVPITSEFITKLSKEWRRYEYFITAPANWNINSDKASLIFGTAYQKGTFDIDDVIITNFESTADAGTLAVSTITQKVVNFIANNEEIHIFGDNFRKYEIVNLSGQLIASGFLLYGKAQFRTSISDGLYIVKFSMPDGTVVANKLLVR